MAYEKLFLGSDVGGIKELIQGDNGFLFKAESKEKLKIEIVKIINLSHYERNQHLSSALRYTQDYKSWVANAKKYNKIYKTVTT